MKLTVNKAEQPETTELQPPHNIIKNSYLSILATIHQYRICRATRRPREINLLLNK